MASGIINMTSSASDFEGRVLYETTANTSLKTTTITLTYQARRVGMEGSIGGNVSPYSLMTSITTSNSITNKSITYSTGSINVPNEGTWTTIYTSNHTITHAADGTAAMTFTTRFNGTVNKVYFNVENASVPIDAIIQKASLISAPNFTNADNPTITYSNPMGNGVSTLQACISFTGANADIAYRSISKTGTSYTFNLTTAEREKLITNTSGTSRSVRFIIRMVIAGETYYSVLTRTFTLNNVVPTLSPTIYDTNSITTALTGNNNIMVRYHSNAYVSFGASAASGATISSKKCVCGEATLTNDGTIYGIDSGDFVLSATDSRGYTVSANVSKALIPYIKPTCNQKMTMVLESDNSAQIHLTISGNFYNGSFGSKSNSLKIYTRYSQNGGSWSSWGDLTPLIYETSGNTYELSTNISGLNPSSSYTFQCKVVDALNTVESDQYTTTFKPVFDWSKTDFNFNVPISIEGNPLVDFVIEEGTEAMGTNGTWYWRKWKSGRAECYGCRNFGIMAINLDWGGLYRGNTFNQDFPSGLFIDTPEVIDISFRYSSTVGGWIVRHEALAPSSSNSGSCVIVRPANATLDNSYISFNVIGRWK